jgi:signal transduction histidine kinase
LLFRVPLPPGLPDFDATLFWRLLTLAALLGAVLWLVTRRLTRPLRDLQAVASALGRSQPPPRIPESGAREIREALRAFNLMQERLQRYLDSRTRVLAAMSHDLRTPLTRLRLRAETAEHQELRERLIADIEEMDALVQRSLALFRGLNDTEEFQATDLNLWLAEIVTEYRELGREFTVSGRANTPLSIRPQALRRALRNLIDNALNYAGATQVELCDNGATVDVAVLDRGPGIPPEQLAAVREPFHRVEISRSRATGGVGLGLAIATEIAAAHGGALLLRNRADGGLEAILSLPRGA